MVKEDKIKLGFLVLLWGACFSPIMPALVSDWLGNSDNSHAFLVPFITLYFLWQRRGGLAETPITASAGGGVLLLLSLFVYGASFAGGAAFPCRVAMVTSLFGLVWCCLGTTLARKMAFPLGLLIFMVPVPYSVLSLVSMPLQLVATKISANLIGFCSIPVYREGNMLYFLQTQLEVAEACSGIRSIMSLTMLSFVLAYLSGRGGWRRVLLLLAAIPIAFLANIFRVTSTGILAHFFGDRVARGFLHEFSGLVVFALGFSLLLAVYSFTNRGGSDSGGDGGTLQGKTG